VVRGWRTHNRPTVRTIGVVASGAGFLRYILRVCQVHWRRVCFVDAETTKIEGRGWQEAYLSHFLTDSGVVKAQLGVFGRPESIGTVIKAI